MELLEQRIKRLREAKHLSQQAVATKVRVSRVAVTKWENGMTANLKLGNLLSLCDLFGVSVEELVRGVGAAKGGATPAEQEQMRPAWVAYKSASPKTCLAVDWVLLPKSEREALDEPVRLAITVLEQQASLLLEERKNIQPKKRAFA